MKNLLVIHYHFLPQHNVGVKQVMGYAKYLPEFGWRVHVLTKVWGETIEPVDQGWGLSYAPELGAQLSTPPKIHRTEFSRHTNALEDFHQRIKNVRWLAPLRKFLSVFRPLYSEYPDRFLGWAPHAVRAGERIVEEEKIDALMSLCPPETNHIVGSRLAARTKRPWIAYFGDLYGFYVGPGDWHGSRLKRFVAHQLRRRWLGRAARTMTVSPYMTRYLEKTYGRPGEVVVVGFDDAEYPVAERAPRNEQFLVSYVGSLYPNDQKPELLCDALDAFLARCPEAAADVRVRLVGTKQEPLLRDLMAGRPCSRIVSIEQKIPPADAAALVRHSDVLLLLTYTALRDIHGAMSNPCKVFDYFGGQRPVLCLPADRDWTDQMLTQTGAGVTASEPGPAAAALENWYHEWKKTGEVAWRGNREKTLAFSHREQARRIAHTLDALLKLT